jgi:hypothetical protein
VNVTGALRLLAASGLAVACSADGPPRPDGTAPFPMPNPRSSGLPHPHSYRASADGLVLDEVTGLEWQESVDRSSSTDTGGFAWEDAVSHCAELVHGGYDDFRLPTRLELVSILDTSTADPAIDWKAFPDTPAEAYWTSTPVAADADLSAYYANLFFGYTSSNLKTYEQFVRCVRDARQPALPNPAERFRVEGGTVLDRMTGLRWERSPLFREDTLEKARTYCGDLSVNENSNFRVPSVKELQTIVDDTQTGVLLDPVAFPNASGVAYWSSTPFAGEPEQPPDGGSVSVLGWSVRFSDGYSQTEDVDVANRVRCVR